MITGVVGKSGAGKNYMVSKILQFVTMKGAIHIDLDKIGHIALEENKKELVKCFGNSILKTNCDIDRKLLSDHVFSDKNEMEKLKNITTPWIEKHVLNMIEDGGKYILNGAILHESKLIDSCNRIIYIKSNVITRFFRLLKRDRKSVINIIKRMWSQRHINETLYKDCYVFENG